MKHWQHILFIFLFYSGCSQLVDFEDGPLKKLPSYNFFKDTTPPKVLGSFPIADQSFVASDTEITVSFSKPMNKSFTESAFILKSNGGIVDGKFRWVENTMFFTPSPKLNKPGTYTFIVSKAQAESAEGANLVDDYKINFYFNPDIIEPILTSSSPANGAIGVLPDATVTLTFSKPMDANSVITNVSSSPDMKFNFLLTEIANGDKVFIFHPIKLLSFGTVYTLTIPNTMKDKVGNNLLQSYSINFTVGNDFIQPSLSSISSTTVTQNFILNENILTNGFEKTDAIILQFTEPILPSTLLTGVSFSPSVPFSVTDVSGGAGTAFSLKPKQNLDINQAYQINLDNQIKDLQGNGLLKTYTYQIRIDGPHSSFLQVRNIYSDAILTAAMSPTAINLLTGTLIGGLMSYPDFYVYFCRGMTAATCDLTSSPRDLNIILTTLDISVNFEFGPNSGAPNITLPTNVSPVPDAYIFNVPVFGLSHLPSSSTYKFTIKGGKTGVQDVYGNYMEQDYTIRLQLQ